MLRMLNLEFRSIRPPENSPPPLVCILKKLRIQRPRHPETGIRRIRPPENSPPPLVCILKKLRAELPNTLKKWIRVAVQTILRDCDIPRSRYSTIFHACDCGRSRWSVALWWLIAIAILHAISSSRLPAMVCVGIAMSYARDGDMMNCHTIATTAINPNICKALFLRLDINEGLCVLLIGRS